MAYKRRNKEFEVHLAKLADKRQLRGVCVCRHVLPSGRSSIIEYEGYEWCLRCMLVTKRPSRTSLWQSIKEYFQAWYGRHIVGDYPYDDQENM
jgi:hypothetical protein